MRLFCFSEKMAKTSGNQKNKLTCHRCGAELTPQNSRPVAEEYSITGVSHWCIDCEQEYYERLAAKEGKSFALFHCCAAFNVPCKPSIFKSADYEQHPKLWVYYLDQLEEQGEDIKDDRVLTFFDGEINIRRIFGKNVDQQDFNTYIITENTKKMPTLAQRQRWGTERIWEGMEMTAEVYDSLDREYESRRSSFAGQTLTLQQENTLQLVAKNMVIYNYCMRHQQVGHAEKVLKMVDNALASEQMRKKDEKPLEGYELMSQVFALEKAGVMEDGQFLPIDKLQEVLFKKFIKGKKFDYTLDACDGMIEAIWKTMRQNADLFIPDELPEELEIEDTFGEFAEEESDEEKERKKFTGFTKPTFTQTKESAEE